jgi:GTP-binding protein
VSCVSSDSERGVTAAGRARPLRSSLPRVVLAGRPNAGKSTLFNRLLRRRKAVVDAEPGVTRDPNEAVATWHGRSVALVDTGGFEAEGAAGLERAVRERGLAAATEADLVLYVLDGKAGLSPADEAAARELRRRGANVLFVVNKLDSPGRERAAVEFHRLGAGELLGVSAEHGHGIGALVDVILARVPAAVSEAEPTETIRVCLIGRPNVGKSSLLNRVLGEPRALVDARAGTTRDALDTLLEIDGARYLLVDTAGIRRRSRIEERLEASAARAAREALGRSQVAVVVIDATEGVTTQDQRLIALAWREGRGVVPVANKIDLRQEGAQAVVAELRARVPALAGLPVLPVSALTGAGVDAILPVVRRVAASHGAELRTPRLNEILAEAVRVQAPPLREGRRPRLFYATQVGRRPPLVAIFASAPERVHPSYRRYLERRIAEAFQLEGTPVRVQLRRRR